MNKSDTQDLIEIFEKKLKRYKRELDRNKNSTFYEGLVKNTEEFINDLKSQTK